MIQSFCLVGRAAVLRHPNPNPNASSDILVSKNNNNNNGSNNGNNKMRPKSSSAVTRVSLGQQNGADLLPFQDN